MKRTRQEAEQTRQTLLQAALDVFYQRGVARATLDDIARAAGVTRGALYWHFNNKEDLFDAMCQQMFDSAQECVSAPQAAAPACATPAVPTWAALTQIFIDRLRHVTRDENTYKFYAILHLRCETTDDNRAITEVMAHYRTLWQAQLQASLEQACATSELPADLDVLRASLMVKSCLYGIVSNWLYEPELFDLALEAEPMVHACMHMLRTSPQLRRTSSTSGKG